MVFVGRLDAQDMGRGDSTFSRSMIDVQNETFLKCLNFQDKDG